MEKRQSVDDFRLYVKEHKKRSLVNKLMTDQEAVRKFVSDGDYIAYDFSSLTRGPQTLVREIIRQEKRHLSICAKFTLAESSLLTGAGCVDKIDVGYLGVIPYINRAVEAGKVELQEWTNGSLSLRLTAGAYGMPFIATKAGLGTDTIRYSDAVVSKDPFTGKNVLFLPPLNPDVGLIHVQDADIYGNSRVFGPTGAALETAMASKKTIISCERIINTAEFRKNPSATTIPAFCVDAVVHSPFGAWPGGTQGYYEFDKEHLFNVLLKIATDVQMKEYLDKWVYKFPSHFKLLNYIGFERISKLIEQSTLVEGYR